MVQDLLRRPRAGQPDLCQIVILAILRRIPPPDQAGKLAAGDLKTIIARNGTTLLPRIKTLARQSPRFRYLLTGIWRWRVPPGRPSSPARQDPRHIGDRSPLPSDDDMDAPSR